MKAFETRVFVLCAAIASSMACSPMSSISASQLQCTFSQLSSNDARTYASDLSSKMGGALSNTCQWAAFLGNVGTESAGLTAWTQYGCPGAPFCGRGPLQITGRSNYAYCAGQSSCGCSNIVSDPSEASQTTIGIGTAYCVWEHLSGRSLSEYADGTLSGFRATACTINAGHTPCDDLNGWSSRQSYWETANRCLGNGDSSSGSSNNDAPAPPPAPPQYTGLECDSGAGSCINVDSQTCSGSVLTDMCEGPANIKCCVASTGAGTSCDSGSGGTCIDDDSQSCSGSLLTGLCPGASNIRCCVPDEGVGDSCDSGSGTCINTNSQQCSGTTKVDLCPGPNNVRCCVSSPPPPPPQSGSYGGYGDDDGSQGDDYGFVVDRNSNAAASSPRTKKDSDTNVGVIVGVVVAAALAIIVALYVRFGRKSSNVAVM